MASGDELAVIVPMMGVPPSSSGAIIDEPNNQPVYRFTNSGSPALVVGPFLLPAKYSGGGFTVSLLWGAVSATSGTVQWDVQIERHQVGTTNINSDSFASAQVASEATPATAGLLQSTDVALTDGAQIDSVAVGEFYRIKITRNNTVGSNMADVALLWSAVIKET